MSDVEEKPGGGAAPSSGGCGSCRMGGELLTTGDMARRAQTTLRTVRFYDEAGLLQVARGDGGQRLFDEQQLQKLRLACDLREAGLSLAEIRQLFELKAGCHTPKQASHALASRLGEQIDAMQAKIGLLRRLREELASTVAVIEECGTCEETGSFPERCDDCEVLDRADLPRAAKLLWNT